MHPCLHIDEIFIRVASNLRGDEGSLLRLALTCRAFYEPGMDVLWARTPCVLEKLILSFPADAISTARTLGDRRRLDCLPIVGCRLRREPLPADWTRFIHHARRVREAFLRPFHWFGCDPYEGMLATTAFLNHLFRRFQGDYVFPNARSLTINTFFEPFWDLFGHRKIVSCSVEGPVFDTTVTFLSRLAVCTSQLKHLKLIAFVSSTVIQVLEAQSALLVACTSLRTFNGRLYVSSSPAIRLLATPALIRPLTLAKLTELELSGPDEYLSAFLRASSLPLLGSAKIYFQIDHMPDGQLDPEFTRGLAAVIDALSRFTYLKSVSLDIGGPFGCPAILSSNLLLPLTRLHHLVRLQTENLFIDLKSGHVPQLAAAWPHMRALRLAYNRQRAPRLRHPRPSVCIEDLTPFAMHCPELQELAVVVAGDVAPSAAAHGGVPVVHRALRELSLGSSYVQRGAECARVARFVRDVFPRARGGLTMLDTLARLEIQALLAEGLMEADVV